MHIVIGDTPTIGRPGALQPGRRNGEVEAKVLNLRQPRKKKEENPAKGERRRDLRGPDPASGCVLVLLTPEGYKIPADLAEGKYRVFIRFMPQ